MAPLMAPLIAPLMAPLIPSILRCATTSSPRTLRSITLNANTSSAPNWTLGALTAALLGQQQQQLLLLPETARPLDRPPPTVHIHAPLLLLPETARPQDRPPPTVHVHALSIRHRSHLSWRQPPPPRS
jgi:hypothetical protein